MTATTFHKVTIWFREVASDVVFINVEFDNSAREMTVYSVASSDNPAHTGNARIISVADLRADLTRGQLK